MTAVRVCFSSPTHMGEIPPSATTSTTTTTATTVLAPSVLVPPFYEIQYAIMDGEETPMWLTPTSARVFSLSNQTQDQYELGRHCISAYGLPSDTDLRFRVLRSSIPLGFFSSMYIPFCLFCRLEP